MQTDNSLPLHPDATSLLDDEAESRALLRGHRLRLIILAGVVALAVAYMVYAAFPGNALFFVTVSEFMGDPALHDGQTLRVSGALVPESFRRESGSTLSSFTMGDKEPDAPGVTGGSPRLQATYVGVLPDLFFNPHSEIILEGNFDPQNQVFATDKILVKCPSKYQSLQAENPDAAPAADGYGKLRPDGSY
jgi:cytochrome c-type biogenesis protein CcmE